MLGPMMPDQGAVAMTRITLSRLAVARLALSLCCLALAACVGSAVLPEVRRDAPGFVFCTPEGVSPLAATLIGRPLDAALPYVDAAQAGGVVVDIAEIAPDGSSAALAIETADIWTIRHRDGVTASLSCIPRDLCTGPRQAESGLCRGSV